MNCFCFPRGKRNVGNKGNQMLNKKDIIFSNIISKKDPTLSYSKKIGDFKNTKEILEKKDLLQKLKDSGLRGRGGAGFSTGRKASYVPKNAELVYLVINADESEPGTCKDRQILLYEPYKLIEGCIIMSKIIGSHICYVYIRGEFFKEFKILKKAIKECYDNKLIGKNNINEWDLDIHIHRGAGAYICGEETALLESIEGKRGKPRHKPPYPAVSGLYGKPTSVYNVETISVIPTIFRRGPEWFASFERVKGISGAGTKLFCISGDVNNPTVVEEKMGINLRFLIEKYCGGVIGGWDNLLAIIPGGGTTPIINKTDAENCFLDFSGLKDLKSELGTGGIMVFNKDRDLVKLMGNVMHFYKEESCGKCTVCREGTLNIYETFLRIDKGNGTIEDIEALGEIADMILHKSFCPFGDAVAGAVKNGFLKDGFRQVIEKRIKKQ